MHRRIPPRPERNQNPNLMKPILIAAVIIVHLALLFYSIAILHQVRSRTFSKLLMATLSLGLLFDVVSTVCMVIGSGKG